MYEYIHTPHIHTVDISRTASTSTLPQTLTAKMLRIGHGIVIHLPRGYAYLSYNFDDLMINGDQ